MSTENQQENLYSQLQPLLQKVAALNLPFCKEFISKWDTLLWLNISSPVISSKDINETSQIFTERIHTGMGLSFDLHFDVTHIREIFEIEVKEGIRNNFINNENSVIKYLVNEKRFRTKT